MKKVLFSLMLTAVCFAAGAQSAGTAAAKKAYDAAKAAADNPKKAGKAATWLKLGDACIKAYEAPFAGVLLGTDRTTASFALKGQNAQSEEVTIGNNNYTRDTYADKALYYDASGKLLFIHVTDPVVDGALAQAGEAFVKAYELDPKSADKVKEGLEKIAKAYSDDALACYYMADFAQASQLFEQSSTAAQTAPLSRLDTITVYNVGYTAAAGGQRERAISFLSRCAELNYGRNGETWANLGDQYMAVGDTLKAVATYEDGFTRFPGNQRLLALLINYYRMQEGQADRLFELIAKAKEKDKDNKIFQASIWCVEGNSYEKLGRFEEALASYKGCLEIMPEYEYAYAGIGNLNFTLAEKLGEKIDAAYSSRRFDEAEALMKQFYKYYQNAAEAFESAYKVCEGENKAAFAQNARAAYFRIREVDPQFMKKYQEMDAAFKAVNGK